MIGSACNLQYMQLQTLHIPPPPLQYHPLYLSVVDDSDSISQPESWRGAHQTRSYLIFPHPMYCIAYIYLATNNAVKI